MSAGALALDAGDLPLGGGLLALLRPALDTVETEDEVEAARLLVQRKLRSMRGLDQQVAIRRLVGMLARKGYSSGIAFRVVREELDADLDDPEHQGL